MTGELSWEDFDGCTFNIVPCPESDWPVLAAVSVSSDGVFLDEMDARVLIDWLQRRLEQASSVSHGIPHTDVPVTKDQTK